MRVRAVERILYGGLGAAAIALASPASAPAKLTDVETQFDRPGNVAAGFGFIAATQAQTTDAQLFVGPAGGKLERVPGARHVPVWAHPHIGTDARGKPVVVFPVCRSAGCDLRMLHPESGTISAVPGAGSSSVDEVEGDLDRGALALITQDADEKMRLVYRPVGGPSRTLNQLGGEKLELNRGRILTHRLDGNETSSGCPAGIIDLTRVTGQRTQLARVGCGADQQTVAGLGFVGKRRVGWGVAALSGSTYVQRDLSPNSATRSVRSLRQFISYAPVGSRRAVIMTGPVDYASGLQGAKEPPFVVYDVTGIDVGATNARGQAR